MAKTYIKDINNENATDWQRMMFNGLPPEILEKAKVTFNVKPDTYVNEYGEAGEVTKKLVKGEVSPAKGQGIKAIGHYTGGDTEGSGAVYSQTYVKDLGKVNGIHIYANYDSNGNLTGFDEGRALSTAKPVTKVYSTNDQYLRPSWDATGKAAPAKGRDVKSGGLFSDFFSDVTSGFDDLVLQNPALRAAALSYYAPIIGSELGTATGTSAATGTAVTNAAVGLASGKSPLEVATSALMNSALPTDPNAVGGVTGPDNIDVGGGFNPASGTTFAELANAGSTATSPISDATKADNIDVGGGYNPATGAGDLTTANAAAATGLTSSAGTPYTGSPNSVVNNPVTNSAGNKLADILPYTTAAGVATGLIQADAAKTAAETQTDAANKAIDLQQKNFETINTQQAPYRAAGYGALNNIAGLTTGQTPQYDASGNIVRDANGNPVMVSGSGYLQHQFDANDLKAGLAPNYDFMLRQGQMANQRAANIGGGSLGGNALQGLNKYTQDYAGNAYQNAFNNYQTQRNNIYNTLAGIAGIGQTGQNATNTAATNATNAETNLAVGSAAANAAGTVGSANALSNTANNIANNYTLASLLNQGGRVAP